MKSPNLKEGELLMPRKLKGEKWDSPIQKV